MTLARALAIAASFLSAIVLLFTAILWYGRSTYGPDNNHPASVSEALGFILNPILFAGMTGFVTLVFLALYWLATRLWPSRFGRKLNAFALSLGAGISLVVTIPLYVFLANID